MTATPQKLNPPSKDIVKVFHVCHKVEGIAEVYRGGKKHLNFFNLPRQPKALLR